MCSVIFLRRPGHDWPLILGANRDEIGDRPWQPPARYWPDRDVVAGRDELAGGTWLGINDHGVVAGVLNRMGTLGPEPGRRSRGELPLDALDHADAAEAAKALMDLDPGAWRPFNMFVADNHTAFWVRSLGQRATAIAVAPIPAGVSMMTAHDLNDLESARIRFYLPKFRAASAPDPTAGSWVDWEALLSSREPAPGEATASGMTIALPSGFGTSSSSLIALPSPARAATVKPIWRFAAGPPDQAPYRDITI